MSLTNLQIDECFETLGGGEGDVRHHPVSHRRSNHGAKRLFPLVLFHKGLCH